jgi:hypothetical protein
MILSRLKIKSGIHTTVIMTTICISMIGLSANAAPKDVADKLCNRINGVPPAPELLTTVTQLVEGGKFKEAAAACIAVPQGYFYNETLKGLFLKWQTPDDSNRVPISDFTTTLIGFVKDDIPFNTVLSADIVYISSLPNTPAYSLIKPVAAANQAAPADMFNTLGQSTLPIHQNITRAAQTTAGGAIAMPADAVAGVMTTREFAASYYSAGTNRRGIAAVLQNFLCSDLEKIHDPTRADIRVRRDVTRSPGGDSSLYKNRCAGCHAGMDGLAGAFAFYDWDDTTDPRNPRLVYTPTTVRPKLNRNASEFPEGYVTTDQSWVNMWAEGPTAKKLGWKGALNGNGLKSLGEALGQTEAFAHCMAEKAVETMCLRKVESAADRDAVDSIAAGFKAGNYNLKNTFIDAAIYCTKD